MTASTEKFRTTLQKFQDAVFCYEAQPTKLHEKIAIDWDRECYDEWQATKGLPYYWMRGSRLATIEGIFSRLQKINSQ